MCKANFIKIIKWRLTMQKNILVQPILTACFVLMTAATAFAGAWTHEQGNSYHRFAVNYYNTDREFDKSGDSRSMPWNGEFRDFNFNYYMEYGVLDRLTFLTSLYYKDLKRSDDYVTTDADGTGDADFGLRCNLFNGNAGVVSLQGLLKTGEFYDKDEALPLGNGQNDYELRLLYGRSLWPFIPGYMNLEAGYRWREDAPADEFRYLLEVGSDLGKDFYCRAKLDAIIGMENGDDVTDAYGNPANTLEYELTKLDLTVGWRMTKTMGLELGCAPAVWGENTAKGETWTFALTFEPGKK